jgi:2,5-diketo-D-gluconate reductase A
MQTVHSPVPEITLSDGTAIPQLGFGTLAVQPDREATQSNIGQTGEIVGLALQAGYRHIDTAQAYGTERGVGKAIAASGIPREELYVTSKLSNANHRPDDVRRSFDETLENLGLEQLDLFLIHWPLPTLYDGDYVSTWKAMTEFLAEGRLRSAGVSNFQPAHLDRIIAETGIVPAVNQFELHPYLPTTPRARRRGVMGSRWRPTVPSDTTAASRTEAMSSAAPRGGGCRKTVRYDGVCDGRRPHAASLTCSRNRKVGLS